jgi:hypothetical protein
MLAQNRLARQQPANKKVRIVILSSLGFSLALQFNSQFLENPSDFDYSILTESAS